MSASGGPTSKKPQCNQYAASTCTLYVFILKYVAKQFGSYKNMHNSFRKQLLLAAYMMEKTTTLSCMSMHGNFIVHATAEFRVEVTHHHSLL